MLYCGNIAMTFRQTICITKLDVIYKLHQYNTQYNPKISLEHLFIHPDANQRKIKRKNN